MPAKRINFEFKNQVSPRYMEPLFLQIEYGKWYSSTELKRFLQDALNVEGSNIVQANVEFWSKCGIGERRRDGGSSYLFRLTPIGRAVAALYSTNRALFFDVMHFIFYSTWPRSGKLAQAPFWLYMQVSNHLWMEAPGRMDSMALTALLQNKSRQEFPQHNPLFPERSVRAIFPWLGEVSPAFLSKCGTKSELCSERRNHCTPQLFHLATDLIYTTHNLQYGTSLAIDDRQIAAICRVCLLDTDRFWEMASLADMAFRELEIRQGQWGTALALTGPPRWIELPNFSADDGYNEEEA